MGRVWRVLWRGGWVWGVYMWVFGVRVVRMQGVEIGFVCVFVSLLSVSVIPRRCKAGAVIWKLCGCGFL